VRAIEDRINGWVKASRPVRALEMARAEAEAMGAMALFGEKYGDWVRVVEVDDVSRELCGGTHVANTAEVGIVALVSEGSSAANVRRIEALSGPAAIDWYRERSDELGEAGELLGSRRDALAAARRAAERIVELEERLAEVGREQAGAEAEELAGTGEVVGGIKVIVARAGGDSSRLRDLADQVRQREGDAAVVLGGPSDGKAALVASFSPSAVDRGASAVEILREAANLIGGGGGGRPEAAQAGGRDAERLDEALEAARTALARALS
jgi:alanyl-tRNA synthetase